MATKRKTRKKSPAKKYAKDPVRFDTCGPSGCEADPRTQRFNVSSYPGFSYTSGLSTKKLKSGRIKEVRSKPCSAGRKSCPVQLFFDKGQTKLRFCVTPDKPGPVISVHDPDRANKIANDICKCWAKNKKSFAKCLPRGLPLGRL